MHKYVTPSAVVVSYNAEAYRGFLLLAQNLVVLVTKFIVYVVIPVQHRAEVWNLS